MSTEPERPIEKLLRSYARKRREQAGAPLELHPVNRRLLHAEIASRKRTEKPESGRTFSLLGRLLWGGAACAVMAIIVALFVPALRSPHEEMARNELTLITNSAEDLPPAVAAEPNSESVTGSSAAVAMLDSKVAREIPKQEEAKTSSLSGVPATQPTVDSLSASSMSIARNAPGAPTAAAAPAMTPPARDDRQQEKEAITLAQAPTQRFNRLRFEAATTNNLEMGAVNKLADVPSESRGTSSVMKFAAAAPASSSAGSEGIRNGLLSFDDAAKKAKDLSSAQYFARSGVLSQQAEKSQTSVMDAFALERSGTQVRIIDGDGSVYTGFVQTSAFKAPAGSASTAEPAAVAGGMRTPQRRLQADGSIVSTLTNAFSYSFVVSGTNQTLNQLVSFSGSFQPSTNAVATRGFGGVAGGGGGGPAQGQPVPPQQPTASIKGKLRVGASPENDFQAVTRP